MNSDARGRESATSKDERDRAELRMRDQWRQWLTRVWLGCQRGSGRVLEYPDPTHYLFGQGGLTRYELGGGAGRPILNKILIIFKIIYAIF